MRGKDLLECMEYIDDALVEEALEPTAFPRKNNIIAKWGMTAACLAIIGISATAFWSHQNIKGEHIESTQEDAASSLATDDTASANSSTEDQAENSRAEGGMAAGTQTDTKSADSTATGSSAVSGSTETAKQSSAQDTDAAKEDAAAVVEQQNELKQWTGEESKSSQYTVISDYYGEKNDSVYDYPAPGKGTYFCYHYLQKTMEYYAEQETTDNPIYTYDVVIDIYGDVEQEDSIDPHYEQLSMAEHSDIGNGMIEQEYRRLAELGYAVRLSEDFQLTGTFTKVELDTFQASSEYGYIFRFADE